MKKVLVLASVASMIDQFNMPIIKMLSKNGYKVDVACNFYEGNTCSKEKIDELICKLDSWGVRHHQIDFSRNISSVKGNLRAYRQVKEILNNNCYSFVHCHSPIGGAIARVAGKMTGTKVIYTAHGFHFYEGAPIKNWMVFYPIERLLSHWTDALLTINKEDYKLACEKMKAKRVFYVPGVGIDLEKYKKKSQDREKKRIELGIPKGSVVLLSVGELNENKNHEIVIRSIADIDVYYLIAGQGQLKEHLQEVINENKLQDRVKLLGFRTDTAELYSASDIFVFPSYREGLSLSLMEAMASGLPCVVSEIRGNTDLIEHAGGEFFSPNSVETCKLALERMLRADFVRRGEFNVGKIEEFSLKNVLKIQNQIYTQVAQDN